MAVSHSILSHDGSSLVCSAPVYGFDAEIAQHSSLVSAATRVGAALASAGPVAGLLYSAASISGKLYAEVSERAFLIILFEERTFPASPVELHDASNNPQDAFMEPEELVHIVVADDCLMILFALHGLAIHKVPLVRVATGFDTPAIGCRL
ncbi:hypothetical protein CERSUDRAFT_100735 [Gelatoporia subvermispora B]|uniref:Uncharacterized protein n=1 Tax=Ceriporiopsis subvermispora (strain B) TaxID=914234 RepID=M2QGE2_CERS8|nr:hypothetical protein CERSUDRAFT_100735 [Gelatoporia subvermispora B]